ncbi:secreted salivary gland peptide [Strigomonas culicis]|uniref:Secreted salivary gland peptide n=1 Tax=Strigomonas culicis TaxID=28005 RepID=S9TDN4_9TRYP|nr:secreted salivary gland peptide [Strigomonas culicis]|eukprot:EPY15064.1 secreted salivary gland peptide [Strigomonas culicis]
MYDNKRTATPKNQSARSKATPHSTTQPQRPWSARPPRVLLDNKPTPRGERSLKPRVPITAARKAAPAAPATVTTPNATRPQKVTRVQSSTAYLSPRLNVGKERRKMSAQPLSTAVPAAIAAQGSRPQPAEASPGLQTPRGATPRGLPLDGGMETPRDRWGTGKAASPGTPTPRAAVQLEALSRGRQLAREVITPGRTLRGAAEARSRVLPPPLTTKAATLERGTPRPRRMSAQPSLNARGAPIKVGGGAPAAARERGRAVQRTRSADLGRRGSLQTAPEASAGGPARLVRSATLGPRPKKSTMAKK